MRAKDRYVNEYLEELAELALVGRDEEYERWLDQLPADAERFEVNAGPVTEDTAFDPDDLPF